MGIRRCLFCGGCWSIGGIEFFFLAGFFATGSRIGVRDDMNGWRWGSVHLRLKRTQKGVGFGELVME